MSRQWDLVIFHDLFSDFPPQARILLQVVLIISAFLFGWIGFNTRQAMNWMARRTPSWWSLRETSISLANKRGWVWVYRIDCAVVFVGIVFMLVTHWLSL